MELYREGGVKIVKKKNVFRLLISIILIWVIVYGIYSCAFREKNFYGKVLSETEICSRIRHIKKEITPKLSDRNYERKSTDSSNIDLLKDSIGDRSITSYYYEIYENEKGTLIELTYEVNYSILWFQVEVKGKEGDYPIEDYKMAVSFYKQFTYGKIDEDNIYKLVENKKSKIGEYRIDSMNYNDVFLYEVNEDNRQSNFMITGLVKPLNESPEDS